jgi:hypothetical protein
VAVWFLSDTGCQAMGGQITSTSLLTPVIASSTANAVGSWVQMHAAAPFPVAGLTLMIGKVGIAVAASNTQTMFDIGIGAAGAEVAIVSNVAIGGALAFATWELPISIPVGSRIAVRNRSVIASKSVTMGMSIYGGGAGRESGYNAVTYGAVTTGSLGTVLTVPTVANTESAWTVLSASTTSPMRFALVGLAAPNNAFTTAADHLIDIGVGTAGAEAAVITDIPASISANEDIAYPRPGLYPVSIPVGSRLVARYRGTGITTASQPNLTVTGIG